MLPFSCNFGDLIGWYPDCKQGSPVSVGTMELPRLQNVGPVDLTPLINHSIEAWNAVCGASLFRSNSNPKVRFSSGGKQQGVGCETGLAFAVAFYPCVSEYGTIFIAPCRAYGIWPNHSHWGAKETLLLLQLAIMHEMGHVIGLGHSNTECVMNPNLLKKVTTLRGFDIQQGQLRYGAGHGNYPRLPWWLTDFNPLPINISLHEAVVRLYKLLLERTPPNDDINHWVRVANQSFIYDVVGHILTSTEFRNKTTAPTKDFHQNTIHKLYACLGRLPDKPGFTHWLNYLNREGLFETGKNFSATKEFRQTVFS